ncbi:YkgJ family cysteine cluster protein [Myxococcota bacterium]|nr:YkgJ family cysteine cluster protein [Myxococcota bacterium]
MTPPPDEPDSTAGSTPEVRPLRRDLRLVPQQDGSALLVGEERTRRVRLDSRGRDLAALLDRTQTLDQLNLRLEQATGRAMEPGALRRTLEAFDRLDLLETSDGQEGLPDETEWDRLPIRIDPRSRFTCSACGSCCQGVNVPFDRNALERLTPDRLEILQRELHFRNAPVLILDADEGNEVLPVCRNRFGACLFLEDRLCGLHRRFGPEAKPLVCRMFPFDFVVAPDGITVSLQMECRDPRAVIQGEPLAAQEEEVRSLLRLAGPRALERDRATLDGATVVSFEEYLDLEREVLEAIDRTRGSGFDLWAAGGRVLVDRWRLPDPPGVPATPEDAARDLRSLLDDLARRMRALRSSVRQEGASLRVESRHLDGVQEAVASLPRHGPQVFAAEEDEEALAMARAWVRNWWWGRTPLRTGDILTAQGLGVLQWLLTRALAVHAARLAERRFLTVQDLVDAWTRVHFFLRNRRVRDAMRPLRPAIVSLLVFGLDTLRQSASLLPGEDPGTDFFLL